MGVGKAYAQYQLYLDTSDIWHGKAETFASGYAAKEKEIKELIEKHKDNKQLVEILRTLL